MVGQLALRKAVWLAGPKVLVWAGQLALNMAVLLVALTAVEWAVPSAAASAVSWVGLLASLLGDLRADQKDPLFAAQLDSSTPA